MSSPNADSLRKTAAELQSMADICRRQIQVYELAVSWGDGQPEFSRFVILSKRLQSLAAETGHCLDALSAEAEAIADRDESDAY